MQNSTGTGAEAGQGHGQGRGTSRKHKYLAEYARGPIAASLAALLRSLGHTAQALCAPQAQGKPIVSFIEVDIGTHFGSKTLLLLS